ncbi:uncharacterized protein [Montipora foliosa]|uniref:uncharacterized protein n=1 Tax=Montipora foliosa TaxID=591990 RepID=UPI0035F1A896
MTNKMAATSTKVSWSDKAVSLLLDLLHTRASLWNTKHESYKDRNIKKREYDEMLEGLREEVPGLALPGLKVKIQSLRTSFREEMRKIKKSMGTGTGAKDVYVSQWKFFDECKFLEEVIISNRPSFCNSEEGEHLSGEQTSFEDETGSEVDSIVSEPEHPKKKKRTSWMETAATALTELATDADNKEDEWDVFGRDVANSLRSLQNKDLQRRVKFSIQSTLFQASESVDFRQPVQPQADYIHNNNYFGSYTY